MFTIVLHTPTYMQLKFGDQLLKKSYIKYCVVLHTPTSYMQLKFGDQLLKKSYIKY